MKNTINIVTVLKIKDLKKSFGDNQVLNNFSMELYEGENLVIMGKSGSGKSVMIKCLVGLMQPDSGTIEIMNRNIANLTQNEFNELRTDIGFLFWSRRRGMLERHIANPTPQRCSQTDEQHTSR